MGRQNQRDIDAGTLPDFIFITPNMCQIAHDCNLVIADGWLFGLLDRLVPALQRESSSYLKRPEETATQPPIETSGSRLQKKTPVKQTSV